LKINRQIRADKVRVIADDGRQLGLMNFFEALKIAEDSGLDLVEIAPNAKPPVCKIIDYGKFRYQLTKKEKESKKSQHQVKVKEVKLKPNIDIHDFNTKVKHAKDFIEKGNKVKVTCTFRGREMLHKDLGYGLVKKFCDELDELASIESQIKSIGRSISTVLAPAGKKRIK
jgi:translation initiation factor IF-3